MESCAHSAAASKTKASDNLGFVRKACVDIECDNQEHHEDRVVVDWEMVGKSG